MHYIVPLALLLLITGCVNTSTNLTHSNNSNAVKKEKKFDTSKIYDGYTFNVYLNNQKVVHSPSLPKMQLLTNYGGSESSVIWKLEKSTSSNINIRVEPIDNINSYIGYLEPNAFEVEVFPLQKVRLGFRKKQEAREDVLVHGSPLLTQINLLEKSTLPAGEYVLKVTVRGVENWDRKEIYFKVEDGDKELTQRGMSAPLAWYALPLGKRANLFTRQATSNTSISSKEEEKLKNLTNSLSEYKAKRDYAKALLYQNRLTNYYEKSVGKNDLITADMYNNKALLHKDLGEYEEALKYNQKSLDIKLKYYPKKYDAISTNYDNMGVIYFSMGQYAKAIKFLKKSLALREKYFPTNDASLADSYNNLAIAFERIGNHKEALVNLKKALEIRKKTVGEEHETTASVYSAMGSIYESLERYEKAMSYHEKAIDILERILEKRPKTEALASAYGGMGTLQFKLHNFQRAIGYYKKMLAIRKSIVATKSLNLSEVYNNIAVSYMNLNQFDASKKYLEKAIEVKQKVLGEKSNDLQEEYKNLGWLYFRAKDYKKAYAYAKKSAKMLLAKNNSYFTVLDTLEYRHFIKNNRDQMDLLFQCTYYLGDKKSYEEAFSYWLAYKGSMLENQNRMTALYNQDENRETKSKIEQLLKYKRTLSRLYQRKVEESNKASLALEIKEYENHISVLKEELSPKTELSKIDFETLVAKLNSKQLYVDFAKIGEHYFGFAIDSNGAIFFRRISVENSQKIDKYILMFRKEVKGSASKGHDESQKEVVELYDILLKTLLEKLTKGKDELIVSADGLLRLLPFEALYSKEKKQYLIEFEQIQYISTGREFLRLEASKQTKQSNNKVVIFSNPKFDEVMHAQTRGSNRRMFQMHFANLDGTKKEAESIKAIMKEKDVLLYEGAEANEENFFKVKEPKILHIATHGFFIKNELSNPMLNSGIVLSGANNALKEGRGEGVVTALKLSGMDLKNTELVVLSACETGLVAVNSPDTVSLLSTAFMQAGAKAIVASLWSVRDSETKELMEIFYKEIEKGLPYVKALQKTKIEMIKAGVSPAVWSAFILNGD